MRYRILGPLEVWSQDQVVALGSLHGRLNESGMDVSAAHGQIWTFRDGHVTRMRWFNTQREALEAAGSTE